MKEYKNRVCIFAHYDKDNMIDEYVYYYLCELLTVTQKIFFVTVSNISKVEVSKLENLNIEVIKRENVGYDFYSYKIGIEKLDLDLYDELIICNDSTFGPLIPMKNIFNEMKENKCDFWGITDSEEIMYHLQSYFIVFRKPILQSMVFSHFWNKLNILDDKHEIIRRYEVGISQALLKKNYTSEVYVKYPTDEYNNILKLLKRLLKKPYKIFKLLISPHRYYSEAMKKSGNVSLRRWYDFLIQGQLPFIKKSLVVDKKEGISNMKKLKFAFQKKPLNTQYPISLIENYFKRQYKEG